MKQLLDKDLFFEELRQLFKDYEELDNTKTTPENLKELVEKQSEVTLRVFGYLDRYTFDEKVKEREARIGELEEALKKVAGFHPDGNPIKLIRLAESLLNNK